MMGVHNSLSPVLISNYEGDFELIVVETKVGRKQIRLITGYWPQEDWDDEHRAPFSWPWIKKYQTLWQTEN